MDPQLAGMLHKINSSLIELNKMFADFLMHYHKYEGKK